MGKKNFKTILKDGTKIKVHRNDETYDNFTIEFWKRVEPSDEWVLAETKKVEIYGLMDASIDAYEHFKAQQFGTTVGNLYNDN